MPRYRSKQVRGWSAIITFVLLLAVYALEAGILSGAEHKLQTNNPGLYRVTRVSDGDTFTVDMNGKAEKVRLIGVDTPETHKPNTPVQCYGPAASAFIKNRIGRQEVRLEADSLNSNRDRYQRLLRYAYLPDGTLLNEQIIRQGYGFYYPYFPFSKAPAFERAQSLAQKEHKGLWGNCSPTRNERGGYESNPQ